MSKYYSEEQVREIIDIAEFDRHLDSDEILNQFTPIELPTDEEISNAANLSWLDDQLEGYKEGAKWVVNKIKGGGDGM